MFIIITCQICDIQLNTEKDNLQIREAQSEVNLLFGNISTLQIGHTTFDGNNIHWNFVVIDQNGEYRGHKHSYVELCNKSQNEVQDFVNVQLLQKYVRHNLRELLSEILLGREIRIITDDKILGRSIVSSLQLFELNTTVNGSNIKLQEFLELHDPDIVYYVLEHYTLIHQSDIVKIDWVEKILDRLVGLDEMSMRQVIIMYVGSLKKTYQTMLTYLSPYLEIVEACPIDNPESSVQLEQFLDNVIPSKVFQNLKSITSMLEFNIIETIINNRFQHQISSIDY